MEQKGLPLVAVFAIEELKNAIKELRMKAVPLNPTERAYLREAVNSDAGRKWVNLVLSLRPPIAGKTNEERSISASEASGYEKAVHNLASTLEEPVEPPDKKSVDIRTD